MTSWAGLAQAARTIVDTELRVGVTADPRPKHVAANLPRLAAGRDLQLPTDHDLEAFRLSLTVVLSGRRAELIARPNAG
jgi:hypothetical protein